MKIINTIRAKYKIPRSSGSFSGITKQYDLYKNQSNLRTVKKSLRGVKSYVMHKEKKKSSFRNPFFVYQLRDQIQIDLTDVSALSGSNNGVTFLLCGIDMFSKLAFCRGMISKSSDETLKALKKMLIFYKTLPKEILSDRGSEFKNDKVMTYLESLGIQQRFTNSTVKCGGVERFNKTIQGKIYRFLTENNTETFISKLDDLVHSYNSTKHRTIGFTPLQAETREYEEVVREKLVQFYFNRGKLSRRPKFKLGDHVRISKANNRFQRSYQVTQKYEIYEIITVKDKLPIPMYELKSLYKGHSLIGGFYESEIIKISCLRAVVLDRSADGSSILVEWSEDPEKVRSWIDIEKEEHICEDI